ncbi:MAG: NAD(P)/FAD-dependent oxidoreductase [Halobacteriales archaeon]
MEKVDVAIVGGGPAGSCAAREAARDKTVVVFEKGVRREERGSPGADSTDAAGFLDYWFEVADFDRDFLDEMPVLREVDRAEFVAPNVTATMSDTGIDSWYDGFGVTFDRVAMDDLLRERAEERGAEYRVGGSVQGVETRRTTDGFVHDVRVAGGEDVRAEHVVLADGPSRRVTLPTLAGFGDSGVEGALNPAEANHIAYQEHRRFPDELFEDDVLRFWWGAIPGETAYPWYFPNDGNVARVGVTVPRDVTVEDGDDYALLDGDSTPPQPSEYVRRLIEDEYPGYGIEDFPLVEDRGKNGGVESYPISSTLPVESPTRAGVLVAGGAMGTTSAFHEGGYHLAVRTGKIAGRVIAEDRVKDYNDDWRAAVGDEVARNVGLARLVRGYTPDDWDALIGHAKAALEGGWLTRLRHAPAILVLQRRYSRLRSDYVAVREEDYDLGSVPKTTK